MAETTPCGELKEAEMDSRTKMKHHAKYLIRQVEAIETLSKECRTRTKELENSASSQADKIPEFLAVEVDETPAVGNSDDENSQYLYSETTDPMTTPHRGSAAALADDLSSCCDTPAAAAATTTENSMRLQQLEAENRRLRDSLSRCCEAAMRIQTNADLKIVRLQYEVAHLRQQIGDEQVTNSRYMVLNQSLRKRLHMAATDIIQKKSESQQDMERFLQFSDLHQRTCYLVLTRTIC